MTQRTAGIIVMVLLMLASAAFGAAVTFWAIGLQRYREDVAWLCLRSGGVLKNAELHNVWIGTAQDARDVTVEHNLVLGGSKGLGTCN